MSVHSRQDMPLFDLVGGAAGGRPDALVIVSIQKPQHTGRGFFTGSMPGLLSIGQGKRLYRGLVSLRCWGVDHAKHCLEMTDGRYFSALLYLLNHPIPHRFAEPLGGQKRSPWVIFGITNLTLTRGQQMLPRSSFSPDSAKPL